MLPAEWMRCQVGYLRISTDEDEELTSAGLLRAVLSPRTFCTFRCEFSSFRRHESPSYLHGHSAISGASSRHCRLHKRLQESGAELEPGADRSTEVTVHAARPRHSSIRADRSISCVRLAVIMRPRR